MRNLISIMIAMCLFVHAPAAFSSLEPGDFEYSANITGRLNKNTLYWVPLSADILGRCSPGCTDLRLLSPDGSDIPYVIVEERSRTGVETYNFHIIRYESGEKSDVITMKLPQKSRAISIIRLNTKARDFNRNIILHGSNSMRKWVFLTEEHIFDFSSQVNLRKTEIKFRPSNYRFYRIRMTDKQTEGRAGENISLLYKDLQFSASNVKGSRMKIDSILGKTSLEENGVSVYDEVEFTKITGYKEKDGETIITFSSGLPFTRIIFDITNHYYFRDIEVYGSGSGKSGSYRPLIRNSIYRFPFAGDKEARDYIDCLKGNYKYYRLVIKNRDNPPLRFKSIKLRWPRKNLFFVALHEAQPYILAVGGASLAAPEYELSKFINQNNWHIHPSERLEVAKLRSNEDYRPSPLKYSREKIEKNILTGIVIAVVTGMSCWLYILLKRTSIARNRREE